MNPLPDVRDYLEPAMDAAGRPLGGARLHRGKKSVIVQVAPAMSSEWQYREVAKVLQPILDRVFEEGRRSAAGNAYAGTTSRPSA